MVINVIESVRPIGQRWLRLDLSSSTELMRISSIPGPSVGCGNKTTSSLALTTKAATSEVYLYCAPDEAARQLWLTSLRTVIHAENLRRQVGYHSSRHHHLLHPTSLAVTNASLPVHYQSLYSLYGSLSEPTSERNSVKHYGPLDRPVESSTDTVRSALQRKVPHLRLAIPFSPVGNSFLILFAVLVTSLFAPRFVGNSAFFQFPVHKFFFLKDGI
ncbi:unnamed protein product [Protopolystoma xenopodis]|uniref:PH domain-containing protein n=1 Tax=Protopolystoma xenopodis TaxID=117903 RepID=A0A3S5B194_9PLAT|nr:unnamed protein product [Protopolystoma xenopodis]